MPMIFQSKIRYRDDFRLGLRLIHEDHGANLVDFAMCIPVWFLLVSLMLLSSYGFYVAHFVANAATDGARYAMVRGSTWSGTSCSSTSSVECAATSTDISNYVDSIAMPGISSSNLSVSTSWPGTTSTGDTCDNVNGNDSPNCQVTVQVSYTLSLPLPFMGRSAIPLSSSTTMSVTE